MPSAMRLSGNGCAWGVSASPLCLQDPPYWGQSAFAVVSSLKRGLRGGKGSGSRDYRWGMAGREKQVDVEVRAGRTGSTRVRTRACGLDRGQLRLRTKTPRAHLVQPHSSV